VGISDRDRGNVFSCNRADGTIYITSDNGNLYAFNHDGTAKWVTKLTDSSLSYSSAIGADGSIYLGSGDGYLYAVNPDGTVKWKFQTNDAIYSAPAIGIDGTIYVGSMDYNLYAVNSDSGGLADAGWPMLSKNTFHIGNAGLCKGGSDYNCMYNAAPSKILSTVAYPDIADPTFEKVTIPPSKYVYLKPSLHIDNKDVGKSADLAMVGIIPMLDNMVVELPTKSRILSETVTYDTIDESIDFTQSAGLSFYILYGYILLDKSIKYSGYMVTIEY